MILTWHQKVVESNETRIGPTYYINADYEPVAVRAYAETAPSSDAEIDIFDDGVSIFNNRQSVQINLTTGVRTIVNSKTASELGEGQNSDEMAENFKPDLVIEQGSWVHCNLVNSGSGQNFTVQLELREISGPDEYAEE